MRMRAADPTIHPVTYLPVTTPLGPALVAATSRGVCDIAFGENTAALVRDLEARGPTRPCRALDAESADDVRRWLSTIADALQSVDQGTPRLLTDTQDVPLDQAGTEFQHTVWRQLRAIPAGQVVSYRELAEAIGAPRSVRAVGSACGANRLAVLIPCHRAVRQDGGLGGFRWGLDRKARLLAWERTGQ